MSTVNAASNDACAFFVINLHHKQQLATGNAHKQLVQKWRWGGVFDGGSGAQWPL
jgi:hypothetical protein